MGKTSSDISSFLSSNCRLVFSSRATSKNPKLLRFLGRTSRNTKTDLTPLQAVKGLIWGRWGTPESGSASPAVLWVDFFKIINISIVISISIRNSMISTELAGYSARSNDRGASGKESLDWQEGEQNFWSSFCAFFLHVNLTLICLLHRTYIVHIFLISHSNGFFLCDQ